MPASILENIKGKDLPPGWKNKIDIVPDRIYTVIVQPQEERLTLNKIMEQISLNASSRGMTPEILKEILGEAGKRTP